jgi:hypothetical protein
MESVEVLNAKQPDWHSRLEKVDPIGEPGQLLVTKATRILPGRRSGSI